MLLRLRLVVTTLFEAFRFVKKFRSWLEVREDAKRLERRAEREHQRLLVEGIAARLVELVQSNQEGLLALAKAQAAQAETFSTWLKSFQTTPDPEPSRVVREEDEWLREQQELRESDPEAMLAQLPPEFRIAYALDSIESREANDPNPGFDREGRDNI